MKIQTELVGKKTNCFLLDFLKFYFSPTLPGKISSVFLFNEKVIFFVFWLECSIVNYRKCLVFSFQLC